MRQERKVKKIRKGNLKEKLVEFWRSVLVITVLFGGPCAIGIGSNLSDAKYTEDTLAEYNYLTDIYGSVGDLWLDTRVEKNNLGENTLTFVKIANDKIDVSKIEKTIENERDIGIIVELDECSYTSLYKNIDLVKKCLSIYDVNGPILLDVGMFANDQNVSDGCLLIHEFCNKLAANNCYAGISGKKKDIDYLSEKYSMYVPNHSFNEMDKMIDIDKISKMRFYAEEIDGNLIKTWNDLVFVKCDFANIIQNLDLNNPDNFVMDLVYIVEEGDTLSEIAEKFFIPVSDLMQYNNLTSDVIRIGDQIVIPSCYEEKEILKIDNSILNDLGNNKVNSKSRLS